MLVHLDATEGEEPLTGCGKLYLNRGRSVLRVTLRRKDVTCRGCVRAPSPPPPKRVRRPPNAPKGVTHPLVLDPSLLGPPPSKPSRVVRSVRERRLHELQKSAEDRGLPCTLTIFDVKALWRGSCAYCGDSVEGCRLDRVDNARGYELGNVAICCYPCNRMKLNFTLGTFLDRVKRIAALHP